MFGLNDAFLTSDINAVMLFLNLLISSVFKDAVDASASIPARTHNSIAATLLIPVREVYIALNTELGFLITTSIISSENDNGSCLSIVLGIKYSRPGRTSRTELTSPEIRLILSIIIILSSLFFSQNIILLCLPIISIIRYFLQ